jgi:hypothetical protein
MHCEMCNVKCELKESFLNGKTTAMRRIYLLKEIKFSLQ